MKHFLAQRKPHLSPALSSEDKLKQSQIAALTSRPFAHRGVHGFLNPSTYQKYPNAPSPHQPYIFIPENTLASFQLAIQNQLAIELDLHYTNDRHLIIFHDNDTYRLTQVSQKIKHSALTSIQELQLLSPLSAVKKSFPQRIRF